MVHLRKDVEPLRVDLMPRGNGVKIWDPGDHRLKCLLSLLTIKVLGYPIFWLPQIWTPSIAKCMSPCSLPGDQSQPAANSGPHLSGNLGCAVAASGGRPPKIGGSEDFRGAEFGIWSRRNHWKNSTGFGCLSLQCLKWQWWSAQPRTQNIQNIHQFDPYQVIKKKEHRNVNQATIMAADERNSQPRWVVCLYHWQEELQFTR